MKNINGNYLKVTLYKVRLCSDITLSPYSLKFEYAKQSTETEKISLKDVDFGGKSYYFELPTTEPSTLEISAVAKTLLIFESVIAKVTIPLNPHKSSDQRQWYYLKNNRDQNIISVLTSVYFEFERKSSAHNNSVILGKSNLRLNKNDISMDVIRKNHNLTNILNRTNNNLTYINNFNSNTVDYIVGDGDKTPNKMDNTVIYNVDTKSPDMSLANNLFSPYSYRNDTMSQDRSNVNLNLNFSKLNLSLHNKIIPEQNEYDNVALTPFDSFVDETKLDQMDKEEALGFIKVKYKKLKDEEEKLKMKNEEIQRNKEKIKQKEAILLKEKEKLETHIKVFKTNKLDFEKKSQNFTKLFSRYNNDLNQLAVDKEVFAYEKKLFFGLNFVLSSGAFYDNINSNEDKIIDCIQKISMHNSNSTGCTSGVLSSHKKHNSSQGGSLPKEVLIEKPMNYFHSREKSNNRSSTESIEGVQRNEKSYDDNKHKPKSSKTVMSIKSGIGGGQYGDVPISTNSESCYASSLDLVQTTKFYTPIAQIDLNKNKNTESLSELNTPKIERVQLENKLMDSLENLAFLSPMSKIHLNDKTKNLKRAGSDEQKIKRDEKKKINSKITLANPNQINQSSKKISATKQSTEKINQTKSIQSNNVTLISSKNDLLNYSSQKSNQNLGLSRVLTSKKK